MRATPAVFLDRDGTLVRDFAHGANPAVLELLPGVARALAALRSAGLALVVVSNQSGVARGLYTPAEARATAVRVVALLRGHGVRLAGYYFCPHYANGRVDRFAVACGCRKPAPGMLLRAAVELKLDVERSWMVGDTLGDVGAGLAAGARSILVDTGAVSVDPDDVPPALADDRSAVARNLPHAAAMILAATGDDDRLPLDPRPLPLSDLFRPSPPPDTRRTGAPQPWPDAAWLARAAVDAAGLARAAVDSGSSARER